MVTEQNKGQNIVITGFMGTGKTTVGRLLAERLQRPFVDMDVVLAERFGKSIAAVFAQEGEQAFRDAEAELCRELAGRQGLVIGTGGGTLVDESSRTVLADSGVLICLTAGEEEILRRLAAATDRPLLAGEESERRQRLRTLLGVRRAAYGSIPYQINTDGLDPAAVADRIQSAAYDHAEAPGMLRLPVRTPEGSYDLCLGDCILPHAGRLLLNRGARPGRAAIVTNQMLAPHAAILVDGLRSAGFDPIICSLPEGEQHKTLASVADLYTQFLAGGLDRAGMVLALGGGVIGDMAGFAAATYLRGVPFVQLPTSLLAMVDASVGGKTGVDLPQGKNLVGAFKQPLAVLMDTSTLSTLPSDEFRSGLAEVVKHGIIGAPRLFEQLENEGPVSLLQLVADAVRVKIDVVQEDPFEQGRRATLNLGHTFGHALELLSEYTLRHGEAVAIGLVAAANLAVDLGRCDRKLAERITRLLARLGLPIRAPGYDVDAVLAAMGHDKKRAGKRLRFVIPQALGDVVVIDDPGEAAVRQAIAGIVL